MATNYLLHIEWVLLQQAQLLQLLLSCCSVVVLLDHYYQCIDRASTIIQMVTDTLHTPCNTHPIQ